VPTSSRIADVPDITFEEWQRRKPNDFWVEDWPAEQTDTLRKSISDAINQRLSTRGEVDPEKVRRYEAERFKALPMKGGPGSGNFGHAGRPGEVGGSAPDGSPSTPSWQDPGGYEHTGITWKQDTDEEGRPIPIKVDTTLEAVALIQKGLVVEVPDARTAYTVISKMAEMAQEAKAAGKEAKDYDLCQISVAGTNLFCAESLRTKEYPEGVPRLEMPQLGGKPVPGSEADKLPRNPWDKTEVDGSQHFISFLQGLGIKTAAEQVPAAQLRASQRELIGSKVSSIMLDKTFTPNVNPIFISRDNYVVDGHHRWAATVGREAETGTVGKVPMNVYRINAPISEVLHLANTWATRFGIQQSAGVARQGAATGLTKP
jgi:hypothetical protein